MHLGVARLCLDCHEVHEYAHCPACTSEAFVFITRWIKLEDAPVRSPGEQKEQSAAAEKIDTYRKILQPPPRRARTNKWLRNGGLLLVAGYLARWGWDMANRRPRETSTEGPGPTDGSDPG